MTGSVVSVTFTSGHATVMFVFGFMAIISVADIFDTFSYRPSIQSLSALDKVGIAIESVIAAAGFGVVLVVLWAAGGRFH